jgi:hypothetical protein
MFQWKFKIYSLQGISTCSYIYIALISVSLLLTKNWVTLRFPREAWELLQNISLSVSLVQCTNVTPACMPLYNEFAMPQQSLLPLRPSLKNSFFAVADPHFLEWVGR